MRRYVHLNFRLVHDPLRQSDEEFRKDSERRGEPNGILASREKVQRPLLELANATTTERTVVVRVRDGKVDWVDVKRGAQMNQLVEVFRPLGEGDQVAVRGTDELRPGTTVQTKLAEPGGKED